jgi:glutamyl/glutaminyl-tRNA synthetase
MRLLSDAPRLVRDILGAVDPDAFAWELPESSDEVFARAITALEGHALDDLEDARDLIDELRAWARGRGIRGRELLHPLRLALTGRDRGPEMARLFVVLGAEEARERIERAREARLEA